MWGSAALYFGLIVAVAGVCLAIRPVRRLRVGSRVRAIGVAASGIALAAIALLLPVSESRVSRAEVRLDEFAPAWHFREVHSIRVAAPPARVFDAIRRVRADEILLFRTLTWIRRGGRPLPPGILNPGRDPIIDVATQGGFVRLAEDVPRELVLGTTVVAPPGVPRTATRESFQREVPPGYALATMNFVVRADGPDGSVVTTETRVYASGDSARRRFAVYWRLIYPGSAIIRRMWLRAIQRRALAESGTVPDGGANEAIGDSPRFRPPGGEEA